ncbi:MAG: translation elongation factor Ts [Tenuifilum sp.]|uniref:translation elongation factor Ts n=1 Tax=Tenuifilum sp. TaxID=2760880 RepID=UPI001B734BDE|nr:elongation factor Ts [Bacteroidales bacterium]HOK62184.1 translation elongation factor Ts [Tenuifilum sp.]MBP9030030.1 elongation factor Ts [Bacteroidales bacterium]HOK86317.1 translation elongation factor Ts [Tenuifilum sp.]HOU74755.1 translation elongation factor Ts [Tenuifilum sp.]
MAEITAADVAKLRKLTGAGMMDCKNALVEANGDMERAIELIRERGKAIANKRADREAGEGAALSKVNQAGSRGAMIVLNCETDFVAKNADFLGVANKILDHALNTAPANLDALKESSLDGRKVADFVAEFSGITGEKVELSYYEQVEAPMVVSYIHMGNKLATLVGFSKAIDIQAAKDVAMQVAAMSPVAIDKDDVPEDIRQKEFEIGREQARLEGKPENMLDKIAEGKLKKFYKESTLLNQEFVKDNKLTIRQYLQSVDKDVKVTAFKRVSLNL